MNNRNSPNYQACLTPKSQAMAYCNPNLPIEDRINDLLDRLSLDEMIALIAPFAGLDSCSDHTGGNDAIDLPKYMWLVETNTAVAAACIGPEKCPTSFTGPLGMGASFNRTSWTLKGQSMRKI